MESSACMFGCRHPAWGGTGMCRTDHGGAPACLCDAGFASRDALGHASCVPYGVLVTGYLVLAALSMLMLVLYGRHLAEYRHLSDGERRSRRTATRLSVILCGSFYAVGMVVVGLVLAWLGGRTGLNDAGIVQVLYVALLPAAIYAALMIAKFWVETLPSQLIPADSFAFKLRGASEEKEIFIILGCLNAGGISTLGIATFFFPAWPQFVADAGAMLGTFGAIFAIFFVAVQITGCINESSTKASASGLLFYTKARRSLWRQALVMSGVGIFTCGSVLVKRLTIYYGRSTPIIFWNLQASSCHLACGFFTYFTKFDESSATSRRRLRRSSCTHTGDVSSTRRSSSLLVVGTTAARQFLQQIRPQGLQNVARRGSDYLQRASSQGRKLVDVSGDKDELLVETAGDVGKNTRRSTVRWASLGGNTAKVLPTEGQSDGSAGKEVPSP